MKHIMNVSACVVDIDATITDDGAQRQISPEHPLNNAVLNVITQLMCERGWEPAEAREALVRYGNDKVFWDYPNFLEAFDLLEKEAWERLVSWHDDQIVVYEDAVRMVRRLHGAGFPLFIVSNNPLSGCFLKLHRAGLAGLHESEYFQGVFGSNVCMGQKHTVAFWEKCLHWIGYPPDQVGVIGDNPKEDGLIPRSLGVETIFLVDRKRKSRIKRTADAIFVNTLDCVPELLCTPSNSFPAQKSSAEAVEGIHHPKR